MSLVNKPLIRTLPEEEVLAEYDGGASITSLCKKHKCGVAVVKRLLIKEGREIIRQRPGRPKKKKPVVNHEEIAAKIEEERQMFDPPEKVIKEIKRKIGW